MDDQHDNSMGKGSNDVADFIHKREQMAAEVIEQSKQNGRGPIQTMPCGCSGTSDQNEVWQIRSGVLQQLVGDPNAPILILTQCKRCALMVGVDLALPAPKIITPGGGGLIVPGR